jgi:putative ABC transport system permease protein
MMGHIFRLGWRNIWRNKRRTYLTLLAIAFGVTAVIFARSYIAGIVNNASEAIVKTQCGHLKIAHEEFLRLERIMPREHLVTGLDRLRDTLSRMDEVELIDARIKFNVLLNRQDINEAALAVGIQPEIADKNMDLSRSIVAGQYFGDSALSLIIGRELADKLKVGIGDELLLVTTDINYSTYALPFRIAGMFETGYAHMDRHFLFIPLPKAQEMLDCGAAAHEILVFLKDPGAAEAVAARVKKELSRQRPGHQLAVIPWNRNEMIESSLPMMENIYGKIMAIIMFIVALVILNTMLMAVMERYHEIGVFKALGFKNREVFAIILAEAAYLGVIGSLIGGMVGGALSAFVEKTGINMVKWMGEAVWKQVEVPIPFFGRVLYPDFSLAILVGAIVYGIVVALVAVLYPALKSARMLPVEAFRSELKV